MKIILSLAITAWIGMALGAALYTYLPRYWPGWIVVGVVLAIVTTVYILQGRKQDNKSLDVGD